MTIYPHCCNILHGPPLKPGSDYESFKNQLCFKPNKTKTVTVTPPSNTSTVHNKQIIIIMDKANNITNKV